MKELAAALDSAVARRAAAGDAWEKTLERMMSVTITRSRYGGTYEPGDWIAFACLPQELPPAWYGNDLEVIQFFDERRGEIGGGATPQEAYEDLLRLLSERRDRL